MNVGQIINLAFTSAQVRQREMLNKWVKISFRLGGQLPNSLLSMSIQRLSRLDAVLRCMEDDFDLEAEKTRPIEESYADVQAMLSEIWIGSAYEIVRLSTTKGRISRRFNRDLGT